MFRLLTSLESAPAPATVSVHTSDTVASSRHLSVGLQLWYRCVAESGAVWCPAKLVSQMPGWPGWWRAYLAHDMAIKCTDDDNDSLVIDSEDRASLDSVNLDVGSINLALILVRPANEDLSWKHLAATAGAGNWIHTGGRRSIRSSLRSAVNYSSGFDRLASPLPPWPDTSSHLFHDWAAQSVASDREITEARIAKLYRLGACFHVRATTEHDGSTQTRRGHSNAPLVRIAAVNGRVVECYWLRRGQETCLGDAWDDAYSATAAKSEELFLCRQKHTLPVELLGDAPQAVKFYTQPPQGRRASYYCWRAFDQGSASHGPSFTALQAEECDLRLAKSAVGSSTKNAVESPRITAMDLYCGCGGLTEGLKLAGIDVHHGVENDWSAAAAWEVNNRDAVLWQSDVSDYLERIVANEPGLPRPGSVDVLAMGPPCQGFTGLGWECEKSASDREELEVSLNFTQKMRPKVCICENVPGLLSAQHVKHLRAFLAGLVRSHYQVSCALHVAVSVALTLPSIVPHASSCRL